jgi:cytochrome c5
MQGRRKQNKILSLVIWNLALWISAVPLATRAAAQVSANVSNDQQAQIEKGRQVVAQTCATCHTTIVRMVQVHKQSAEQWKDTVYFMISRGAQIMPDEVESVTAYLAAASASSPAITQTPAGGRPGARGAGQQTPEGDGAALLRRTCQQCHELATASTKLPSEEWSAVIARMIAYGAKLTPADQQNLTGYLNGLAK